ncbi:MAG: 30S ribosomal protein S2 [Candidatus Pacebacteria bacterium]|nr:30S ribosomal protein S2 [Candidatus Paceibacterota bacterium]
MSEKEQEKLIDELFSAGVHYGYSRSKRHPSMKKALYGVKNNKEIIDLGKTVEALAAVEKFVIELAKEGKKILFVGSKNQIRDITEQQAQRIDMPYVKNRWIGGMLTNFSEIKKRMLRLKELTEKKEKGELGMYTKKERIMIDREVERLDRNFGGAVSITDVFPAAMFVVDPKKEEIAVNEALSVNIPIIAIANSDCDIDDIDYPIPANDSARASVELLTKRVVEAYRGAQKK